METKVNFTIIPEVDSETCCNCTDYCRNVCKGYGCCENSGCVLSPNDIYVLAHEYSFEDRVRYLKMLLYRGDYSIDHKMLRDTNYGALRVVGNPFEVNGYCVSKNKLERGDGALYLRARNRGKRIVDLIHFNWEEDGPCAAWNPDTGCKFSYSKRPKGGRLLMPAPEGHTFEDCEPLYDEYTAALEWVKFQDVLYEVYMHFRNLGL